MAQIDPSIVLQSKGVQLENPLDVQYRSMQLRGLAAQQQAQEAQMQDAMEKRQQQRTLADLYRGNVDTNSGKVNRQGLMSGVASAGLGDRIPDLQKQFAEEDKVAADAAYKGAQTEETKFKVLKERLTYVNGTINSLLSRPQVTHDEVIQSITSLVNQGMIDQQQGADMVRMLPGNPTALRQFLVQKGLETMDAAKRMDLLTPKFEKVDNGGSINMGTVNPLTGQFTPGQAIKKVATPDAVLREAGDERRSIRADNRAAQTAKDGKWQYDATRGGLVNLQTGQFKPAIGPDGEPVGEKGAANKVQRTQDANDAIALIDEATKLLEGATGSYAGKAVDIGAQVFGKATPGAQKAARLKALEGMLVSKMPKMSGPQSDKDVAMYKQMAATVGDDTQPTEIRKAALDTVREIQERYAGMPARPTGNLRSHSGTVGAPAPAPAAGRNITVDY